MSQAMTLHTSGSGVMTRVAPSDFHELNMSAITFTAPPAAVDPYSIIVYVDEFEGNNVFVNIDLIVLNSSTTTTNTPPRVNAGPNLSDAIRGQEIQLSGATATDAETATADLTYAWTVAPSGAVTFDDATLLNPEITVADDALAGTVTLTLTVNDGTVSVSDSKTFTVTVPVDPLNTPPQVDAGPVLTITKGESPVTLTGATATDAQDDASATALTILWTQVPLGTVTIGSEDHDLNLPLRFLLLLLNAQSHSH